MGNAEKFYHAFLRNMDCSISLYKKGGNAFTEFVIDVIYRIIEKDFLYTPEKEYFRIDVIGWIDRKDEVRPLASQLGLESHLWDLKIAVEHENDSRDWTDELIKLAHIRCPLKVIIGYTPCDCRGDMEQAKLDAAASWVTKVSMFGQNQGEEFLLILGNASAQKHGITYDAFGYRGYLFDPDLEHFTEIE